MKPNNTLSGFVRTKRPQRGCVLTITLLGHGKDKEPFKEKSKDKEKRKDYSKDRQRKRGW